MSCGQDNSQKDKRTSEFKKVLCRFCNSQNTIKWCRRKTQNRGLIQRYKCKSYSKFFSLDDGFFRMRNSPQKITLCLDLFFRGVSTRKIQEHLQTFYPQNSSWVSIYEWVVKYSELIHKFTDKFNVNTGIELMSDEMEFSTKGKQTWFVDVMDTKTRYIVSSEFMRSRTLENLNDVLGKAKTKTGEQIKVVTTDGLQGYSRVLRKTFGLQSPYGKSSRVKSKITHNIVIASERGFNHKIERLHNSTRERTKITRGFHGSINSAKAIMQGYEIFYNFIRKHQALGKCPYELAIQNLKLGMNKWLDLIYLSKSEDHSEKMEDFREGI